MSTFRLIPARLVAARRRTLEAAALAGESQGLKQRRRAFFFDAPGDGHARHARHPRNASLGVSLPQQLVYLLIKYQSLRRSRGKNGLMTTAFTLIFRFASAMAVAT